MAGCCKSGHVQCILGKPLLVLGTVVSGASAAVSIAFFGVVEERDEMTKFNLLVVCVALCLVVISGMLVTSFSCPNKRYASLFGFLQFAVGKAALLFLTGMLDLAAGVIYQSRYECCKDYYGENQIGYAILCYLAAGLCFLMIPLIFIRSMCLEDQPTKYFATSVGADRTAAAQGSAGRSSAANSTAASVPAAAAPAAAAAAAPPASATAPAEIPASAFGSDDNPFV